MPELVSFAESGRYALYTGDYDLLTITDALRQSERDPWLTITDVDTGQRIPLEFVGRGMRVYDSHSAPGRPVLTFVIPRPGFYRMGRTTRPALIAFARDYVTGNEGKIAAVFVAELALLAAPFVVFYGDGYRRKRAVRRQMQRTRRAEADAVFRSLAERRTARAAADDDDPHAPFRPKN
jgi:hypothetical protein